MGNHIAVLAGFVTMCGGLLYLYNDYKKKNIQSIKNIRPKMKGKLDVQGATFMRKPSLTL